MIIIGITGTLGAGKGTIVNYLVKNHGFVHYSVRDYLSAVIKSEGLPLNRDSLVKVANRLRKNHSPSYIIEQLYEQAIQQAKNCIIESIRTVGEIEALRKKDNFYLFAVDAEHRIRYNRILKRKSETDIISYETFINDENREMTSIDPNKQNLSACIAHADFIFSNNGTYEDLYLQIEEVLKKIKS